MERAREALASQGDPTDVLHDQCPGIPWRAGSGPIFEDFELKTQQLGQTIPRTTSPRLESSLKFRARVLREGQQNFGEGKKSLLSPHLKQVTLKRVSVQLSIRSRPLEISVSQQGAWIRGVRLDCSPPRV